jgi:hypothetical protein
MLRSCELPTRALMVMLFFTSACLSGAGIAHCQDAPSFADADHPSAGTSTAPCQDASTSLALRETLRLVCSRERVGDRTQDVRRAIIVGFVGGFVKPDDVKHPEVLFATYLQNRYGPAVHVEIFGNHESQKAAEDIVRYLDADKNGVLTTAEKESVRIILYGHSWGASEVLNFARELQRRSGIPIALTIQIDSVKKFGQDNRTVPANVAKAVNFYQRKGFTPGQPLIVPADASRTKILGNFHMTYEDHEVKVDNYGWLSRVFNKPHHQIENDPHIWDRMVTLIDSELLKTDPQSQAASSSGPSVLN